MRGGTSKGLVFSASDLPSDPKVRDRVLLRAMGSPDARQIDGLGGATPVTSKVAIVSPSKDSWAQVDYLFAQVSVDKPLVDLRPTCGNMLAAVSAYAVEMRMVPVDPTSTRLRIHAVNTGGKIEALVSTPGGTVDYGGDASIDGVPGTAAPIFLSFREIVGSKTGMLLPTGRPVDIVNGIRVTCLDVAMPMVLIRAQDVGKTGQESPGELQADRAFMQRIEAIRLDAGRKMGMGDVSKSVIPKLAILSVSKAGGTIASRYFTPDKVHPTHAVTGAICVCTAARMRGTVAYEIANPRPPSEQVSVEHPSGNLSMKLETVTDPEFNVLSATLERTARKLMSGHIFVPTTVWRGE
jgi:4-oxalomesaconate tautomerase